MVEFIEMLKLDRAFLYDLLEVCADKTIKPKKFPKTSVDEVVIGHTNEPEYKKLQEDELMEALKDRTSKVDVSYVTIISAAVFSGLGISQALNNYTYKIWLDDGASFCADAILVGMVDRVRLNKATGDLEARFVFGTSGVEVITTALIGQ